MDWIRDPFYGGCRYYSDEGATVTGYYSPSDPVEFETDCKVWVASCIPNKTFSTADEAMRAADSKVVADV